MSSQDEASFLLKDVCIFTGEIFIEHGYVLVQDGKVIDRGDGDCLVPPEGILTLSRPGHTVLPGLIDSHLHGLGGNILCIEQSLRFGVTTVLDMHNDHRFIHSLQQSASSVGGNAKYSDFKCCGVSATIQDGWPGAVVLAHGRNARAEAMIASWPKLQHPAEAEWYVQEQIIQCRASHIKLMHELGDSLKMELPRPQLELQKALVNSAHRHGLPAVGHAFSFDGAVELLECGVDGLTHIFFDEAKSDRYIQLAVTNKAHCNPTLSTCASQTAQGNEMQVKFTNDPLAQRMLFDKTPRQNLALAADHGKFEHAINNTRALYKAGVPIIVGSDSSGQPKGTPYGLGVHIELHLLVHEIGMKPVEVLKSATSLIADRFKLHDRGRIETGKKADLILMDGDAREILADKDTLCLPLRAVWREGVLAQVYRGGAVDDLYRHGIRNEQRSNPVC